VSSPARVLLAEADAPTRMGLRVTLDRGGFEIAAEVRDAHAAVVEACRQRPDAALIAADLPGGGIDAARQINGRVAATRIVVLSSRQSPDELVSAVSAGAAGYLGKDMSRDRLPRALDGVLAGEAALPRRYTEHLLDALRGRTAARARMLGRTQRFVTERQWEVLELLAEGRSTAEVARRLGISEVTARRHISSVLPKLGLKDRQGAVDLMRTRSSQ
jgi:DNA-binding NarL/FixJ family response regulator